MTAAVITAPDWQALRLASPPRYRDEPSQDSLALVFRAVAAKLSGCGATT